MKLKQAEVGPTINHFNLSNVLINLFLIHGLQVQFAVNQSLMGNKANSVLNEMKLSFILNQKTMHQ